jgi:hypothetical protein
MNSIQELLSLSPEVLISKVLSGDVAETQIYTLPLDTAFTDYFIPLKGLYFGAVAATDITGSVDIEFNRLGSGKTTFTQGLYVTRPFGGIYITSSAQAGKTISFVLSMYAPLFKIDDNRSNTLQATYLANILDQMQGQVTAGSFDTDVSVSVAAVVAAASDTRRAVFLFADKANTDNIHIGFSTAVTSVKKVITLAPGESFTVDDYRGDVSAIAGSGTQKLSVSSW